MTVPFPEAQRNPLLGADEIERHVDRLKNDDVSEAYLFAYDALIYHPNDQDILRDRVDLLLPHIDEVDLGALALIAALLMKLSDYDQAFSTVDLVIGYGYIGMGRKVFFELKDEDQDWLVEKGLNYLKQSADAGHILARRTQMDLQLKRFGFAGRIYRFFWRLSMIPLTISIARKDKNDPRLDDLPYEGKLQANLAYMKLSSIGKRALPKNGRSN